MTTDRAAASGTDSGGFRFASHLRTGLIAVPGAAGSGTVTVSAVLSDGSATTPVTLGLASVGDVQGIDPSQVTRQYPPPGATDAETEFFPLIEFAVPELPWMLPTPAGPQGPLPWLCLVVVADRDGVSVTGSGPGKPDVLHISAPAVPAEELPDPAGSVLWAHAFAATSVHTTGTADPTENPGGPALSGCRLLAPRRLLPQTSYIACLVPTLKAAALAGLGHQDDEVAAALAAPQPNYAWSPTDNSVALPAYLHWEFSCGAAGDFESLARSLQQVAVGPAFGTMPLDLGLAGPGLPVVTTLGTVFRGALVAPGAGDPPAWPGQGDADQQQVDTALTAEISAVAAITAQTGRPAVGPLLYARAAAGRGTVSAANPAQDWFDQLNRDPRARAVAGLATRVLRRNVENVMAQAWAQAGEIQAANAALRRLQVSRAVTASIHSRHLSGLTSGRLMLATRPLLGRVAVPPAVTGGTSTADALAAVAASALPAGATWRGMTRALRPGTRLGDLAGSAGSGSAGSGAIGSSGGDAPGRVFAGLAAGIAEPDVLPDGTVGLAAPSTVFGSAVASLLTDGVRAAAATAALQVPAAGADAAAVASGLDALAASAGQLTSHAATSLTAVTGTVVTARPLPTTVTLTQLNGVLVGRLQVVAAQPAAMPAQAPPVSAQAPAAAKLPTGTVPVTTVPVTTVPVTTGPVVKAPGGAAPVTTVPVGTLPVGTLPVTTVPVTVQLPGTDARLATMRTAYAAAVDRFVRPGIATALPQPGTLDLDGARTALLANLDPAKTVAALAAARVPAIAGVARPDPVAPVMAGPVFTEPAYTALAAASHDAFVPGLDSVPVDSVTLLQSNPVFIAAYLAGLNSALGHELLWRGYPTDERGTYWHSFWGAAPDIGPLHQFHGSLSGNVDAGAQPVLVLVLRGRLLQRYPDCDVYAVAAGTDAAAPELDDGTKITRPVFRDFTAPDITLVGFPLTYDQVAGTGGGPGYWFVLAEHPGQPRFGLTDPDPAVVHPPLPSWDELSWADLGVTQATLSYVPQAAPPMAPGGTTRRWGASAADMAAITYQPAVRVAIRARDLLPESGS